MDFLNKECRITALNLSPVKLNGIKLKQIHSAPYYPASNGAVERLAGDKDGLSHYSLGGFSNKTVIQLRSLVCFRAAIALD